MVGVFLHCIVLLTEEVSEGVSWRFGFTSVWCRAWAVRGFRSTTEKYSRLAFTSRGVESSLV